MNFKKSSCVAVFLAILSFSSFETFAQVMQRPRIAQITASQPTIPPPTSQTLPTTTTLIKPISTSRPVLTNDIRIAVSANQPPLVKKTALSTPANAAAAKYMVSPAAAAFNNRLSQIMDSKLGIPYHYGSTGPRSIDCSGLVWMVFQEAGIDFERSSASSYWREFEPVYGDERFKFGTLVFFNDLGHVGIVVNENGFYHASSSKGVTYSSFDGYWAKRIVGFRRIPLENE